MAHYSQSEFMRRAKTHLPERFRHGRVLDVGSWDINGSARTLFEDCDYVGSDLMPGPGVDVVGPGEALTFPDDYFDVVLSCECFEHNPMWQETLANMIRMLKPGGLLLLTCATTGRAEHGTDRLARWASRATIKASPDHYRNLTARDFDRTFEALPQLVFHACITNIFACDLYVVGIKKGTPVDADLHARLARFVTSAGEIRLQNSLTTVETLRYQARGLTHTLLVNVVGEAAYHNLRYRFRQLKQGALSTRFRRTGRWLFAIALPVWLVLQVIAGPVRFVLDLLQAPVLVYIPSAALALAAALLVLGERARPRVIAARWMLAFVLLCACRAAYIGLSWKQIAFGGWILVPLFAGLLAPPALFQRQRRLFGALLVVAIGGIVAELIFGPWPWQGHMSSIAGVPVEATHVWGHPSLEPGPGWRRLAGFSRVSYAAASQVLLFALAWEALGGTGRPSWVLRIAGFAAGLLTTSKGILLSWVAVAAADAVRPWRRSLWRLAFLVPALITCLLPFVSSELSAPEGLPGSAISTFAGSLVDRMRDVWPAAIAATMKDNGLWLGHGLGSAGTAQWYFDRPSHNPVDNAALFVFMEAGILGLALLGMAIARLALAMRGQTSVLRWSARVLVATAVYAITTSILESPEFALFFGFAAGRLCKGGR